MRFLIPFLAVAAVLPSWGQNPLQRDRDPIPAAVENIYTRGLRALAATQSKDGSWPDQVGSNPGVVGLAVMAFLAHGEDPNHGPYAGNIKAGISFILEKQDPGNGYIGDSMYNHGFATLALAECYGMYHDPKIATALKKAVRLTLSAQKRNPLDGWRYSPDASNSDTSIAGCQIVSLYAARNAGIPIPDTALDKALKYMRKCRGSDGGYGYQSAMGDKATLTAIGVLCESLAKEKEGKLFNASVEYLTNNLNYRDRHYAYYFEYYMAQALFHSNEEVWQRWNEQNTRYLSTIQGADGSFPGSRGASFNTAGALLSLALNYRLLPIYEK